MLGRTSALGLLPPAGALSCGGDEFAGILARIKLRISDQEDTWARLTGGMMSPRSAQIDAGRRVKTQATWREAGCSPFTPVCGADDCETLAATGPGGQR